MRTSRILRSALASVTTFLLVTLPISCGSDSTGPGGGGPGSSFITDPTGDTFGSRPVQWDITTFAINHVSGAIDVELDFTNNVISPMSGDTLAPIVFVDFDLDQDSTTGVASIVDTYRPSGTPTGLGVDCRLDLSSFNADSTAAVNCVSGGGLVKPVYSGKKITAHIPLSILGGDDGKMNAAAIVGTSAEPTDIVPNNGHLSANK